MLKMGGRGKCVAQFFFNLKKGEGGSLPFQQGKRVRRIIGECVWLLVVGAENRSCSIVMKEIRSSFC